MSDRSAIEWTESTWNPVTGCSKVSPGCANCYAETISLRFGFSKKPWTPENAAENVVLHPERLDQPLRWRRPRMVFVNSMSDLFHEQIPDEYIAHVFEVMRLAPRHTFQVLTKRPERAADLLPELYDYAGPYEINEYRCDGEPLPNVWLGVSIENARHTWRADVLREIPAAVRFISAEPLLGSLFERARAGGVEGACGETAAQALVQAENGMAGQEVGLTALARSKRPLDLSGIDWLIVGGESGGRQARPMHPDWARELRDACEATGCEACRGSGMRGPEGGSCFSCHGEGAICGPAFFLKQHGSWRPACNGELAGFTFPDGQAMVYAGAGPKSGGRLLDGREWNEMPA